MLNMRLDRMTKPVLIGLVGDQRKANGELIQRIRELENELDRARRATAGELYDQLNDRIRELVSDKETLEYDHGLEVARLEREVEHWKKEMESTLAEKDDLEKQLAELPEPDDRLGIVELLAGQGASLGEVMEMRNRLGVVV